LWIDGKRKIIIAVAFFITFVNTYTDTWSSYKANYLISGFIFWGYELFCMWFLFLPSEWRKPAVWLIILGTDSGR
jgi:hypothetical protein